MFTRALTFIRERWHPLWRLRRSALFRRLQNATDRTVYTRIPGTGIKVAVKAMRDASWILHPAALEPEIQAAFALVLDVFQPAVFWDLGANIGFYSWLVRQHPAVRQVVMFEPDPTNFELITQTIRRNRIDNCQALNVALSSQSGESSFVLDRASGAAGALASSPQLGHATSLDTAYGMTDAIVCQTESVDELIAKGTPAPAFMKIDVEGAERQILVGAVKCFEETRPVVIVETFDREFLLTMTGWRYALFQIDATNFLAIPAGTAADLAEIERRFPRWQPG